MAVNSKADKTGGHRSSGTKTKSYSAAPVTPSPLGGKIGVAGAKALAMRARKELQPIEDPMSPAL